MLYVTAHYPWFNFFSSIRLFAQNSFGNGDTDPSFATKKAIIRALKQSRLGELLAGAPATHSSLVSLV